jgi:uncharacterized protein (TIGR02099 family)
VVLKYSLAFLKHGSLWIYRLATAAVLLAGVAFVSLVLGLRYYVLPNIDDYRASIERAVARAAGQPVTIGSIKGNWQGYRPELHFLDVKVLDEQGQPALQLQQVDAVLAWLSLLVAEVRFESLEVQGPRLEIRRDPAGVIHVAGIAMGGSEGRGGFGDWLLAQRQVLIRDAGIFWLDELRRAPGLQLDKVNFRLDNAGSIHKFGLSGLPPAALASAINARGEFRGRTARDLQAWTGRLYVEFDQVSLPLAQAWIDTPLEISSGTGSLRVWLELAGTRVTSATAEVGLANVRARLEPGLPELALTSLAGRLGWKDDGKRREISAASLAFVTADGLRLSPMRFTFARTGEAASPDRRSELQVERLDLAPVAQLAEFLPLTQVLRDRLARSAPTGMIDRGEFAWAGAFDRTRPYMARAAFSGLSLLPDGALPGVRGLSGQIDASERGGTVALSVTEGSIELPKVFEAPVSLDVLSAGANWTFRDGQTYVTVRNATFTNEHAAGNVYGSYHTEAAGRGVVDLTGTLVRAEARHVWRYVPVRVPGIQAWLKNALLAGESRDVRLRLKGRLGDFPFEDEKKGLFEVIASVSGATLDYARGWPQLTDVTGDLMFRGRRMEVRPQSGSVLGMKLADMRVSIDELGKHDEHLLVKGTAEGQTDQFLRFVEASPIAEQANRFTEQVRAKGEARLSFDLDLPLHRIAETKVAGELVVRDNQVVIDPRLPELDRFNARIAFARDAANKGSITVREGRALLLGHPIGFEAAPQADGGIALKLGGTLDAARLADLSNLAQLRFLSGQFAWTGNVSVRNKIATVRFDSDLAGLESRLPAPLVKAAQSKLPLRVELLERPGRQGVLALSLGGILSAQLVIEGGATDGIRRGMVDFGGQAALADNAGLWIRGKLDQLDVDAWNTVLAGPGSGKAIPDIAGIDLEIGNLTFSRRQFHDLKINVAGQRNAWQGTLAGREIAGQVSWAPENGGRLVARLSKLVLPAPATGLTPPPPVAGDSLPSLDIVADSFTFEGKDLGQLTVRADPEKSGWTLQQMDVVNPDATLAVNGRWITEGEQHTDVTVKLDVVDIGKFFARLGYPDSVKGGSASLEGPVGWSGGPARLDIRSLSGRLKLEARDGRFQQIKPGVAKLLGIVSLQSLPRRLSLDFDDIFRKGFTFDRIAANLELASGAAHTEDFLMEGSAAKVSMRGTVDLAAETQNLNLRVTPSLSESIAVAGAILNPAIGVVALIAQKALKDPFSSIAALEYTVSGPWTDPVVTRVARGTEKAPARGR